MDIVGLLTKNYIHIPLIVLSILIYGILLYLVFFKPIKNIVEERRRILEEGAQSFSRAKEEIKEKTQFVEEKIKEARKEGARLREELKKEAYIFEENLLKKVKEEIETLKKTKEEELSNYEKETMEEIKNFIPLLSHLIAEKILKRRIEG